MENQVTANTEAIKWMQINLDKMINHATTSPETDKRLTIIETEMKGKVSYKQFYWVIGIMMTILMSTIGYLIDQIHELQINQYDVAREVSTMAGSIELISNTIQFVTTQ